MRVFYDDGSNVHMAEAFSWRDDRIYDNYGRESHLPAERKEDFVLPGSERNHGLYRSGKDHISGLERRGKS